MASCTDEITISAATAYDVTLFILFPSVVRSCSAWFLSNRQAEHWRYLLRHHEVASKFLGHG